MSGIPRLSGVEPSKEKLAELQKIDDEKILTAEARNKLESYVIDMKYLMTTGTIYTPCSVHVLLFACVT